MDGGTWLEWLAHADERLGAWMQTYGAWVYLLLFIIVFLETNVIFGALLPGDTLVIASGALAATGHFVSWAAVTVIFLATVCGYFFNYGFGFVIRRFFIKDAHPGFMQRPSIQKAELFFREHARAALLFARFIPFMRSIAPLVSGMSRMPMGPYAVFNVLGGALWAGLYFVIGYLIAGAAVLSGKYWLIPPCVVLVFVPAWLVSLYFQRRRQGIK